MLLLGFRESQVEEPEGKGPKSTELLAGPASSPVEQSSAYMSILSDSPSEFDLSEDTDNSGARPCLTENCFEKQFINAETGKGLVAAEFIPIGITILEEKVIWVKKEEKEDCPTLDAENDMIGMKVKAMGARWHCAYLDLPNPEKERLGDYGGIWEEGYTPIIWDGVNAGVLGLNLARINHSCVPNAYLSITSRYRRDENGEEVKGEPTMMGRAVVIACSDIMEGQEITIGYIYGEGKFYSRKLQSVMPFGFKCSCQFCVDPTPKFEDALARYHKLESMMRDEKTVDNHPAEIYQMAHDVLTRLTRCEVTDMRVVMIWLRCALIAAFNSDLGRAKCFLAKARKMTFILQGPSGPLYGQITKWYDAMQLMPGFAATTRGLSSVMQSRVIYRDPRHSKEVLFMLNARPDEYVRLHRYRRLQDDEAQEGHMFGVLPDEDTKRKRFKDEDPHRAQGINCYKSETTPSPPRRRKKICKLKGKCEPCVDPERHPLDLMIKLADEVTSSKPHEEKEERTEKQDMSSSAGNKSPMKLQGGKFSITSQKRKGPKTLQGGETPKTSMKKRKRAGKRKSNNPNDATTISGEAGNSEKESGGEQGTISAIILMQVVFLLRYLRLI